MLEHLQFEQIPLEVFSSLPDSYHSFIIPKALFLLKEEPDPSFFRPLALICKHQDQVVGLALAKFFLLNRTGQIYSLSIKEKFRRQGIGTLLFQRIQQLLLDEGSRALGFEYESNETTGQAMDHILAKIGWPPAQVYMVRCYYKAQAFNPRWLEKCPRLRPGLKPFPWRQLKASELSAIQHMAKQGTFLPYLSPLRESQKIDPINSLGLRHKNKIVGWVITHRVDRQTIRYSALYIDKDYKNRRAAIPLLAESIRLHKKSSVPWALFEVNLKEVDLTWWHFVKKKLIPYADRLEKVKWAFHIFTLD